MLMVKEFYNFLLRISGNRRGLVKFMFVGGINTVVDFILYSFFANILAIYPPLASIISTGLTLILSFYLNHTFVFRSQKKKRLVATQFVLITLFNVWVIQSTVIAILIHVLSPVDFFSSHQWTLNTVAKIGGVCVSFILNFIGYRYIFKDKSYDQK